MDSTTRGQRRFKFVILAFHEDLRTDAFNRLQRRVLTEDRHGIDAGQGGKQGGALVLRHVDRTRISVLPVEADQLLAVADDIPGAGLRQVQALSGAWGQ